MKKEGDSDGKRLRRILALHQLLRSGKSYSTEALRTMYFEKTGEDVEPKTLQNDLRFMRLELGAPLPPKANKHKGYSYVDNYSILEALDDSYYGSLNEVVALLRQSAKSKEFVGLEDILIRLEKRVAITDAEKNAFIAFEEVELKGMDFLPQLHQRILKKIFLQVKYQPYDEPVSERYIFPLLLKEYNNRWFLMGWEKGKTNIQNLALDRMVSFRETVVKFPVDLRFNWQESFNNMIGVTLKGTLEEVILRFNPKRFPYVETKKLHHSQQIVDERTIRIRVYTNPELLSKILEFGADVEVLAPDSLRQEVVKNLLAQSQLYPELKI